MRVPSARLSLNLHYIRPFDSKSSSLFLHFQDPFHLSVLLHSYTLSVGNASRQMAPSEASKMDWPTRQHLTSSYTSDLFLSYPKHSYPSSLDARSMATRSHVSDHSSAYHNQSYSSGLIARSIASLDLGSLGSVASHQSGSRDSFPTSRYVRLGRLTLHRSNHTDHCPRPPLPSMKISISLYGELPHGQNRERAAPCGECTRPPTRSC